MHRLLWRQLKRQFGNLDQIPAEWELLLKSVGDAYHEFDTDRRMLERSLEISSQELLQANSDLRAIFEALPDLFFRIDADDIVVDYKAGSETDLALPPKQVLAKSIHNIPSLKAGNRLLSAVREIRRTRGTINFEYALKINGEPRFHEARLIPLFQNQVIIIIRDISVRKQMEEQLRHQALHDSLTGLPNRTLFTDRLEHVLVRCRHHHNLVAILFLDLDRFKVLNDSLGHFIGDQLLIETGRRLQASIRPEDSVARLGGDEFAILLEDGGDVKTAIHIAERVQNTISQPFMVHGHEVFTTASIGIAFNDIDYLQVDQMLRDADIAMYRAKSNGKARYEIFNASMHARASQLLQLETDLRRAIDNAEFEIYYQPIINLKSGRITAFEALIRWHHPQRGLIAPLDFIPLAEETGMIIAIGKWVLYQACHQVKEWQIQYHQDPAIAVSVNVSSKQLAHGDLVECVEKVLEQTGIDGVCLKLELTESMIMENPQTIIAILEQLKKDHIQFYIDDFGTGYSSLSYLHKFPVDTLKIDRSFVNDIGPNGGNAGIVNTIVTLARNLNLEVIAEGVENAEQLRYLKNIGCNLAQGYYFSRPVPAKLAQEMITHNFLDRISAETT